MNFVVKFCLTKNMNVQCCICHDNVRVPVRFICFPCKNEPGQPSCNSINRVCLACAREYLQLHKKWSDRVYSRKCLTCPVMVRCSQLSAINSYEKDFFMMSHDEKQDYPCFHDHRGCNFQGTQNQLDHHIQSECPYRIISCRYCKSYYEAKEDEEHVYHCSRRFRCFSCLQHVPVQEEKEHYLHQHQQRQCIYCKHYIHVNTYDNHATECPERPQECVHCHEVIAKHAMYDHLIEHVCSCEQTIHHYTNAISVVSAQISQLVKESQKYR